MIKNSKISHCNDDVPCTRYIFCYLPESLNIEILEGSMIESCQNLNIGRTSILRSTKFSISKYLVPANLNLGSKLRFNLNLEIGMFKNSRVSYYNDTFRAPGTFSDICQNLNIEILEGSMIESCQNLNIGRTSILRSTKFSISKYLVPANLNLGSNLRFDLN